MVKVALQIKANLENIEVLSTDHPNYNFLLKLKCTSCGEVSTKWHDVMESQTFPTKTGKSETHFLGKCKLCGRENSMNIVEGSNGKFTSGDTSFKSIVTFDCRGVEPIDFSPSSEGWIAKAEESGKIFDNVDLTTKDWADYDDKANQSVGIYELESQFVKVK